MPTVLLGGFQPFDGETINPSWQAVSMLAGETLAGHDVATVELPVTFAGTFPVLREAVVRHRPGLVLLVGQAGGRSEINLERVALNLADTERPDNDGSCPVDQPIIVGGPAATFSGLPLKAMHARLSEAGIPAKISNSAGTYVCNHVFYRACQDLKSLPVGLIHVPYAPAQTVDRVGIASMAVETVAAALRIAATAALEALNPLKVAPGQPAR